MEIEKKRSKKNTFADLSIGDVFIYDSGVYMVIEKVYGLGDDRSYNGYATDLKTGWIYGFDDDEGCIKVTAKLTVTD